MSRVKSCLLVLAGVLYSYVPACMDRAIKVDEGRQGCMSFRVGTQDGVGALLGMGRAATHSQARRRRAWGQANHADAHWSLRAWVTSTRVLSLGSSRPVAPSF